MNQRTFDSTLDGVHEYYQREIDLLKARIEKLKDATDTADINVKIYVDTIGYTVNMMDGDGTLSESYTRDMGCDLSEGNRRLECVAGLRAAIGAEIYRFLEDFDRGNR